MKERKAKSAGKPREVDDKILDEVVAGTKDNIDSGFKRRLR